MSFTPLDYSHEWGSFPIKAILIRDHSVTSAATVPVQLTGPHPNSTLTRSLHLNC